MGGRGAARPIRPGHRGDEPADADRRWLALAVVVFVAALGLFAVALWVYHATGPHPEVWVMLHKVRGIARSLLPRWSHRHW